MMNKAKVVFEKMLFGEELEMEEREELFDKWLVLPLIAVAAFMIILCWMNPVVF